MIGIASVSTRAIAASWASNATDFSQARRLGDRQFSEAHDVRPDEREIDLTPIDGVEALL